MRERRALVRTVLALTALLGGCGVSVIAGAPMMIRIRVPAGVRRVSIPGTTSGFRARAAYVYIPPGTHVGDHLPVLELLHGVPGGPADWIVRGRLRAALDEFAAAHHGHAPIVVLPDINGARRVDTECVRAPDGGDVEQYLTVDVPRWVATNLPATSDRRHWAIAGLSEGGTCSTMLALRHYRQYRAFADLSGLARPTVGDRDDPQRTVQVLFDGSVRAYHQHDPLWLLRRHRYAGLSAWFGCGRLDRAVRADQDSVSDAARKAGIAAYDEVVAGGHTWQVWRTELHKLLPWLWAIIR